MLRPERQQQRIFGRRGLQLEIELAAESLAQRQAPRLVDAAAERRVQHELHAAGFVEEPLEHQRLLRRHRRRAWRGFRRDTRRSGRRRRDRRRLSPTSQPGDRRAPRIRRLVDPAASSQSSMSPRSPLTARDSSSLRAGASPSQNGMFGGAPFASATRIDAGRRPAARATTCCRAERRRRPRSRSQSPRSACR